MSFYYTSLCVRFPWKCYKTTMEVKSVVTGVLTQCGYICHTFIFLYSQSALRLEQEIKLCVKRNALFVIGVKRSSGTPIFAVLRFPSSYNDICNISLLRQRERISCCGACVVWDREPLCHHIMHFVIPFSKRSLRNCHCRNWFMNINLLFVNVLLQILCCIAP